MKPLVSIISTFYNSEKFIKNAMDYLLNQTYSNIEFICVNDGSVDNTLSILTNYSKQDSRIKIINKKNERAAHYARAAGQDIASGKYCFLFDHDDKISLDLIECAVNELEKNVFDMVSPTVISNDNSFLLSQPISGLDAFKLTIGNWKIHLRPIMKREIFQSVSFRDLPHAILNGDEYIDRKILLNCKNIGFCNGTYYYTPHEFSETKNQSVRLIGTLETDILLKKLLCDIKLYDELKYNLEKYNLRHLFAMFNLLMQLKGNISKDEYDMNMSLIRKAYHNINKKYILKITKNLKVKIYYSIILFRFNILYNWIKIKN
ncbi:glycosyltransferase family 2 protein [Apibacter sp. HY039]|uniref:glycosyltransferase family 2 protein n=1 Tax=Apibacter sp. HY039 TaxID=2501476 RepID=UPI000FEBC131|nr:glycosyltransferase family 2 protein [Apibacter sp. HY039]